MSRISGSTWSLDVEHDEGGPFGSHGYWFPVSTRYRLRISLTTEQARRLLSSPEFSRGLRGCPSFTCLSFRADLTVKDIELTHDEAMAIGNGTDPLEILFPLPWPDCGYRLTVVPDSGD